MSQSSEMSTQQPRLLVIDDDRMITHQVETALKERGIQVVATSNAEEGLQLVRKISPDVVLLDIMLPGMSGLELFQRIHLEDRRLPVIFITAGAGSETAIEAMQLGAYDYVAKPLDLPKLADLVDKAIETRRLMSVPVAVSISEEPPGPGELFVGRSSLMLDVFKSVGRVSKQNVTVLIRGESGTGKELVARALYQFSHRKDKAFMAVNCAALPDTLLESELFGHEKGSFTGADRRRIGKFEQCNGGTLFLDEVGDMSPLVQGKVLRLLQEQRFERVGGNETIATDVRVIAATNQPLEKMVEEGDYRADLFYRFNGVSIFLPPLRQRKDDIPLLLQHFLTLFSRELQKGEIEGISPEALELLMEHRWPGNVREMQSVVRQMLLQSTGPVIVPEFLPPEVRSERRTVSVPSAIAPSGPPAETEDEANGLPTSDLRAYVDQQLKRNPTNLYADTIEMVERYLFTRVLQETDGNQTRASEILGITRGKIRDRIAAFHISLDKSVTIDE